MRPSLPFVLLVAAAVLAGCIGAPPTDLTPTEDPTEPTAPTPHGAVHEGRIVCGVGSDVGSWNPCLVAPESRNVFPFTVHAGIETLIVGVTWSPTTTLGERLSVLVETDGFSTIGEDGHRYVGASGKPDIVLRIDADATDGKWSWHNVTSSLDLQVRVFPGRGTVPSVVLDQSFHVHVVAYHDAPAPADADPFRDAPHHGDH